MGTFTERGRRWVKTVMEPPARMLLAVGVGPDAVTVGGTVLTCAVVLVLIPRGDLWQAVLLAVGFVLADSLDGTMARLSGRASPWGAFLDSTLDRVTDAAILLAIGWYYLRLPDKGVWVGVTAVALVGSFLVSYARARAESLGMRADVGFAERAERLSVLGVGLLVADLWTLVALDVTVVVVAVMTWVTVGQRMVAVRRQSLAGK